MKESILPIPSASSRRINPFDAPPTAKKPSLKMPSKQPVCGKRHKKRLAMARGRILGGSSALPGTHPWMAAIYIGKMDFCAGTLVSSCWLISAAHCFFQKYDQKLRRVCLFWLLLLILELVSCGFSLNGPLMGGQTSAEASCGDSDLLLRTRYI